MTLSDFRKRQGLSQAEVARRLTAAGFPATQALVSQWETGAVALGAERARQIEQVFDGAITRADLLPDLFGPIQPTEPSTQEAA